MQIQTKPITDIHPYEKNPRFNDNAVEAVAKSIKEFGFQQPIVVDKDFVIIVGHTRLKAAERLGLTEVPVVVADNLTPEQVQAYRIADNKTGEIAEWNYDLLPLEIKDLQDADFDLSLLGFDTGELEQLLNGENDKTVTDGETEPDAVPEVPENFVSKRGEVYQLGEHRLMCGDSTSMEDTAKLMGEDKARLYLVDPPYNVALQGSNGLTIQNDNMSNDKFREFLDNAFKSAVSVLEPGTPFYIFHSDSESVNFRLAANGSGLEVHQTLYWIKNAFVLGRFDYHYQSESCQPAGTIVWTAKNGRVPIEQIKDGDEVMSLTRKGLEILGYRHSGFKVKVANRDYNGELCGIRVGDKITWTTPEHRFAVRFKANERKAWCTYLMKRGRMWRIGKCQLFNPEGNGVKMRLKTEKGEAAWILGTYRDVRDAFAAEQGLAIRYGIPTTHWEVGDNPGTTHRDWSHVLDIYMYQDMDGMEGRAKELLKRYHRQYEYPMITRAECWRKFNRVALTEIRACNILPEFMEIIIPYEKWDTPNNKTFSWETISKVEHKNYTGKVYSLDVDKHHFYIADGILTHNCLYGWTSGAAHNWYSDRCQTNVLNFDKPKHNDVHPSMKPVEMLIYLIQNSSRRGEIVIDNFGGSGSTLIACEQTGRKCRTMELDEKYCDVIRRRWAEFTHGEGCDWQALTPAIKNQTEDNTENE